jgi:hypothetical protein
MYVVQISDRAQFAAKAKSSKRPVSVVRQASVVPVNQGGSILMCPAVVLQYSIQFDDREAGETSWVFKETRLANERGDVDLRGTLWDDLERNSPRDYVLVHRSGSI